MRRILIPGQLFGNEGPEPAAEPWPVDDHTIRVDEMFARQLDTEFSSGVRNLMHHPETGLSALKGETALEAIAGAMPALQELKDRTLAQAIGPRQRGILEPMIETRLDWAAGTIGQLAHRATVEVDDQSVVDRIAGLNRDAATAWHDPTYLRKLGRTAVNELRYQGERRGWEAAETDTRVRAGLSDLYVGAIEAAIGQDDLDGAAALYDHARPVLDPEHHAAIDHRFVRAREVSLYRDIDRDLADLPLDPAEPPGLKVFERRAADLVPEGASDTVRAGMAQVAEHAQRRAERQWHRQQTEAGLAVLDWFRKKPDGSFLAIPPDVRDWLAPDQWQGLEALYVEGRLATDHDLFERLDRQMVHEPDAFVAVDLDRYRLSLGDADYTRFTGAQKAIAEGRINPDVARYDRLRLGIDRAFEARGIDTDGPVATKARAGARDWLESFEVIEGRPPNGRDVDNIVRRAVDGVPPANSAPESGDGAPHDSEAARPDTASAEESALSAIPAGFEAQALSVAATSSEVGDNVSAVFPAGSGPAAMPATVSTEDGKPPPFSGDAKVIRVGGGSNSSRRAGGGRPLTRNEEIRAANFQSTLNAIRELEPNNRELTYMARRDWVPGQRDIARVQEELLRAKARAAGETSAIPIGPYARESIPARSAERNFTAEERREIDRIGNQHGCHTCGTTTSGSKLGHWVPDHQLPSGLNRSAEPQHLYPQCLSCSALQGGQVTQQRRREKEDR